MKVIMPKTELSDNQQGFASIVVALILILVLSLLTIGLAQLARREQQNSLDKQLAIQANYAAESGINDAIKDINTIDPNTGQAYINSTNANSANCMTTHNGLSSNAASANSVINSSTGVSYTCLLVDLHPPQLQYTNVPASGISQTFNSVDGNGNPAVLSSLTVNWSGSGYKALPPTCPYVSPKANDTCLPPSSQWENAGYPPVLEVKLTEVGNNGANLSDTDPNDVPVNRSSLLSSMFTVYMYPSGSIGNSVQFETDSANQGKIVNANCSTVNSCNLTITGINGPQNEWYLINIIPIYDYGNLSISTDATSSGGTTADFADGEIQIDVTGQAKNVLKRLRVAVPVVCGDTSPECAVASSSSTLPGYAIEGNDICKQFSIYPNGDGTDTVGAPGIPSDPSYPDTCP